MLTGITVSPHALGRIIDVQIEFAIEQTQPPSAPTATFAPGRAALTLVRYPFLYFECERKRDWRDWRLQVSASAVSRSLPLRLE